MRAALFVDFDNIFISFAELDERAAQRFATQPARWLAWFESGAHALGEDEAAPQPRRILVRRCYLNPVTFGRYRADYTRAAFTVVDCPPLTQRGKTSADVYMVMDVLDALEHKTAFDEFIILSSDADFTPVLLRLRAHDRRTTIIATNVAAAAYKAACDNIVHYEQFFEEALGIEAEAPATPELPPPADFEPLLRRIARMLHDRVAANGPLSARDVPMVFSALPEFRNSNWFGCFSLRALMSRLLAFEPTLRLEGDPGGAWTFMLRETAAAVQPQTPDLASRALEEVRRLVTRSPQPVPIATAAHQVNRLLGPSLRESRWAGHGTFKALLMAQPIPGIELVEARGGYLVGPGRHDHDLMDGLAEDRLRDLPEELAAFIRRVSTITGTPALAPTDYARLFGAIAELSAKTDQDPKELPRGIRDLLQPRGVPASAAQINFVLNGFRYTELDITGLNAAELARAWRGNVLSLLDNARFELSGPDFRLLDRWLLSRPVEPARAQTDDDPSELPPQPLELDPPGEGTVDHEVGAGREAGGG